MAPVNHFGAPLSSSFYGDLYPQAPSPPLVSLFLFASLCPATDLFPSLCLCVSLSVSVPGASCILPENSESSGKWEMPECTRPARCASAFIPIQVATIQYRIYGALTLSRQEGTARLMGWAGWGNNRLFDVTSLIGVDLLTD